VCKNKIVGHLIVTLYKISMQQKRYYTIKETAQIFGVTPLTLRNWDKSGKFRALRNPINNYRLYRADQIEMLLRKIENRGRVQ